MFFRALLVLWGLWGWASAALRYLCGCYGKERKRMLQTFQGVVLGMVKYTDRMNIAQVYTAQLGTASFLVPLQRSRTSAVRQVLFQPLSLVEFEADVRPTASLHRIKEARALHVMQSLPYHPYKSAIALFLAEFLRYVLRQEDVNAPLFAYLLHSIRWLDACTERFSNFHLVFLMRLSRFVGLYPNVDDYAPGYLFDMRNACFVPDIPDHGQYLRADEAESLHALVRMNYDTMRLFVMNRGQRVRCLEVICEYYRLHVPDFPELKSLDVLHDLF